MTDAEFRALVAELRAAQKDYFLRRSPERLALARRLERRVDDALKPRVIPQPSLFDREPD